VTNTAAFQRGSRNRKRNQNRHRNKIFDDQIDMAEPPFGFCLSSIKSISPYSGLIEMSNLGPKKQRQATDKIAERDKMYQWPPLPMLDKFFKRSLPNGCAFIEKLRAQVTVGKPGDHP